MASYAVVMDATQPISVRLDAFSQRTDWNQPLHGSTAQDTAIHSGQTGAQALLAQLADQPDALARWQTWQADIHRV